MTSPRVAFKQQHPRLHRLFAPIYWRVLRPAFVPLMERLLSRALQASRDDPRFGHIAASLGDGVSLRLSPRDRYAGVSSSLAAAYVKVGLTALDAIERVRACADCPVPRRILDFPCGHGRVLRFLKAAFPDATLTACDLDRGMVDFCVRELLARGVYSADSPRDIVLNEAFDLIWCSSLFTHLEKERWPEFLNLFHSSLDTGGLLVFTTHGARAAERIRAREFDYGLGWGGAQRLLSDYATGGFGYGRYPESSSYYGVSLSSKAIVLGLIERFPGMKVIAHIEHGWDDHQDVFACQRVTSFEDRSRGTSDT